MDWSYDFHGFCCTIHVTDPISLSNPYHHFIVNTTTTTDFGWYGFKPKDDAAYKVKQESELMNGRLAMMAIGGIATQSVISGGGFPYI